MIFSHKFNPVDLSPLKTYPIAERVSLVGLPDFAKPWVAGRGLHDFVSSLPDILAAKDLTAVISSIVEAFINQKTVVFSMGAHVIKVGLSPVVIDLMRRGIITAVAMNGAGIIHDLEVAMIGRTSEDVWSSIGAGSFGMASEPASFLCDAVKYSGLESIGLGEAVGLSIINQELDFSDYSILATAALLGIPVTVHIAIGTDIFHMHPGFDPKEAGSASHRDFRTFASVISTLEGGVYLNVGSAVILPEVFLKAVTLVRNLGHALGSFTSVNMDFIKHYRPMTNVVNRPTADGGHGFNLIGHHEIMLPLIAAGVLEQL